MGNKKAISEILADPLMAFGEDFKRPVDLLVDQLLTTTPSPASSMPINPQDIERLKAGIDLASYIASRGIALQKNGRNHKGLCPFHEEKEPSFTVNPAENLWHCFGCGSGGDVFTFVERMDRVSFTRAVGIVGKSAGSVARPSTGSGRTVAEPSPPLSPSPQPPPLKGGGSSLLTPSHQKLLNRVVQFYQQELWKDKRGLNYLKQRGLTDRQSLIDFGVGFVGGNLLEILPSDGDYEAALKQIGILNERGHEMFYGCVVFPLLDSNHNVTGLYGRRIDEDQVAHLYLPGPRRGLINRQAAKRSKTLFLTESIIDALSLYANGFKNVIPLYGINGWTEDHERLFREYPPETVYLCFDSDEAGTRGAYAIKEKIRDVVRGSGIGDRKGGDRGSAIVDRNDASSPTIHDPRSTIHVVKLPVKDLNDYFRKYRAEEFEQLLKEANPQTVETSESHHVREERFYEETPHGFLIGYGKREYEVKGIARVGTQLKATLKASLDIKGNARFQITTLDLYSLRSREWFAKIVAELTGEREELVREDLNLLLTRIENYDPRSTNPDSRAAKKVLTSQEKEEALSFLQSENLFDEILADLEFLGCTGEETNKLVAYLVAVSRKMEEPLSLLIQSRSAAGKSTLQDAILSLVPEEDYVKYTRLTDQALFYKEEDSLVNKVLAIEETRGMGGAAYSIRAMQSSKKIRVATTSKDPATGKMKTEEYTVKGPVAILMTTTEVDLDNETESRFLTVAIDESGEMTKKIHEKQREQETLEGYLSKKKGEACVRKHQNAQRLLRPLAVVNPYAPYLAFPSENLRSRRDHKKYLNLMKAIAFLHQYQREVKTVDCGSGIGDRERRNPNPETRSPIRYIEVTLEDIAKANKLANEVLGRSLDELSAPSRTLLGHIHQMVKEMAAKEGIPDSRSPNPESRSPIHDFSFNRRSLREFAKWSEWQVRLHIQELEDLGYVYSRTGARGKEYLYELRYPHADIQPSERLYLGLTDVSAIAQGAKAEISQIEKITLNFEAPKTHFVGEKGGFVGAS